MATRTLDRLLLIPALIVIGSLTLAGCSLLPGANANPSNSSSSDKDDEKDAAEEEEAEQEDAASGCPDSFDQAAAAPAELGGQFEFISAADFSSSAAIGSEFFDRGCLFRVTVDTDGVTSTSDFGYLPGDAATVAAISANLEAGGYTKLTEGMFSLDDSSGVFVFASGDTMSETQVDALDLGFGDSFVIVMATKTGQ